MSVYAVKQDPNALASPRVNSVNGAVTQANSTTEAKAVAKTLSSVDNDALWGAATVTDVTSVPDLTGWAFTVAVNTSTPTTVTYTGIAADTVDAVGAALVLLLNASGHGITHSAYNTSTNALTVAGTADTLGDKTITATVTPPTGLFASSYSWTQSDLVTGKTDGGSSGAALILQLSTTWAIPGVVVPYKQ